MVLNAVFVDHFCLEEWLSATCVWDTSFDTELGLIISCITDYKVLIVNHTRFHTPWNGMQGWSIQTM